MSALARLFATLTGELAVCIRLELVDTDACRCLHVDDVALRLLCTYAGLGTDWLNVDGRVQRVSPGSVIVLKKASLSGMRAARAASLAADRASAAGL